MTDYNTKLVQGAQENVVTLAAAFNLKNAEYHDCANRLEDLDRENGELRRALKRAERGLIATVKTAAGVLPIDPTVDPGARTAPASGSETLGNGQ